MVTGRASARSRAWFLAAAAVLAAARPAASLRVAFVSDTGVGNANPRGAGRTTRASVEASTR